jgi:hypothetical protein
LGQVNHVGDVADELDLKSGIGGRPEDHLIEQRADDLDCLGARGPVFQEALEGRQLPLVYGSEVGVKADRLIRKASKFFRDRGSATLPQPLRAVSGSETGYVSARQLP